LRHLFCNLEKIFLKLKQADRLVVFLDYDGTLSPISSCPNKAALPNLTRKTLKDIVKNKKITVSIISGRMLKQVKKMVGIKGIYYAGCHGLEMENNALACFSGKLKKAKIIIKHAKLELKKSLKDSMFLRHVKIEDKGLALGLHYRRAKKHDIKRIRKIFYATIKPYMLSKDIVLEKNKKVLEIKPNINWDKGSYCIYFLSKIKCGHKKVLPVYIGDDKTDESAFAALKGEAITVFVRGERKTSLAKYYLDSTSEVRKFLKHLAMF
jgi:trehalose 6-phosphate phosphatase